MSQKGPEEMMADSYMAGTTISRHVGGLVPLTTEQYMASEVNQQ